MLVAEDWGGFLAGWVMVLTTDAVTVIDAGTTVYEVDAW